MSEILGLIWFVFGGILLAASAEFAVVVLCFGFATILLGFSEIKYILREELEDWKDWEE